MNPLVLRRFVIIAAIATFVAFSIWTITSMFVNQEPGDYYTRQGDIRLGEKKYGEAMESFNKALTEMPDHRGALMGRAIVFLESGRNSEAVSELTYLIGFLNKTLEDDDRTGRAVLAAAYANRGIIHDREARYPKALEDYVRALATDPGALEGPGLFDKILYGTPDPSLVRDRSSGSSRRSASRARCRTSSAAAVLRSAAMSRRSSVSTSVTGSGASSSRSSSMDQRPSTTASTLIARPRAGPESGAGDTRAHASLTRSV